MRNYILTAFFLQLLGFLVNVCSALDAHNRDKGSAVIAMLVGAFMMAWGARLLGWL